MSIASGTERSQRQIRFRERYSWVDVTATYFLRLNAAEALQALSNLGAPKVQRAVI